MANTLNLGTDGNWATKEGSLLAYNSENGNYKPLPFTFDRASSATRVNKDGLIETVGSGQPRIDYKDDSKGALKLEPSRTNLITYSEDFTNAIWTNSNAATIVNPTANLSPDGTLSGNEFNEGSADARRGVYEDVTVSANTSYTLSVFVKKGTSDYLRLVIANGLNSGLDWTAIQVDLSNNSISTKNGNSSLFTDISSSISDTDYNGYYRLTLTAKHPTTTTLRVVLGMSDGVAIAGSNSIARRDYVGTNKYLYVWGVQIEQGSYATSYIPTQGSTVTRLAESCEQTPPSGIIGQTEGTLFVETSKWVESNNGRFFSISDGTTFNYIVIIQNTTFSNYAVYISNGGITQLSYSATNTLPNNSKIAISYKLNNFVVSVNGEIVHTDTSGTLPSTSKIYIGSRENGATTYYSSNPIKDARLYNTRLSNTELQALTKI